MKKREQNKESSCFRAGFDAYTRRESSLDCPYPAGSRELELWAQGFLAAQKQGAPQVRTEERE